MNITTGLIELDRMLGGSLAPGNLILAAGSPSSGMTTLLDTAVLASAFDAGVPTVLVDTETSPPQRINRLVSARSGVPLEDIQRQRLTGLQEAKIAAMRAATSGAPLSISDARTMTDVKRDLGIQGGKLLAVDGLRFLDFTSTSTFVTHHDSDVLVQLKKLALEANITVLASTPTSRRDRTAGPLSLSDLPDGFEQAPDAILLLDRDESMGRPAASISALVEISVVKNRHGSVGSVDVLGQFTHARFVSLPQRGQKAA